MKLLKITAVLCASVAVPYLLLALIAPPPLGMMPLSVVACLPAFIVPRGRALAWGAIVIAAALVALHAWLDYKVLVEGDSALGAAMVWVSALLTAGCFGLVLLLRTVLDASERFFGRSGPRIRTMPPDASLHSRH
jgi:hypothetical protein